MATQIDLGAVVPIGKGDWNPSTTYERANIVRHNSVAWICKVATSLGIEPTETSSDWYLLVKDTSSVTSINGMRGDVTIDSVLENPSVDDNSLKIASTAWTNTKVKEALGLPLGHIYLWPFSTPPDGSIQLNGSTYSRELYSDLWNLIQEKGWYKPEAEWQSIASVNGGYCPWYSDGDGSTTFRTPKFAPYQKLALVSDDVGKYYEAGLPNITGAVGTRPHTSGKPNSDFGGAIPGQQVEGAFTFKTTAGMGLIDNGTAESENKSQDDLLTFNASLSNPIYGKSSTVQPESNNWIVCVVAFGKATNVGSVDVANVMSAISQVQANIVSPVVGSIMAFAANSTPTGYLICNGATISRTTYATLFAVIGTIYGSGDGSTTFNLPNLTGKFIQGSSMVGTTVEAGLPNIIGASGGCTWSQNDTNVENACNGAFTQLNLIGNGEHYAGVWDKEQLGLRRISAQFNASKSNAIYGKSDTVQPPALTMRYYIKY